MKHLPNICGALLGLLFIASGVVVLLKLVPMPLPPEGTPAAFFMGAMIPSGYFAFVKVLEILGGLLVIIPALRGLGLLILGPILVNILAFHTFIMKGEGLFAPPLILICLLAGYLLWIERRGFLSLCRCGRSCTK
jgi:putative oxidoreductase